MNYYIADISPNNIKKIVLIKSNTLPEIHKTKDGKKLLYYFPSVSEVVLNSIGILNTAADYTMENCKLSLISENEYLEAYHSILKIVDEIKNTNGFLEILLNK